MQRAPVQVDILPPEPQQLPHAGTRRQGQVDQRVVWRPCSHLQKLRRLLAIQDAHLRPTGARRRHRVGRVADDELPAHGIAQGLPEKAMVVEYRPGR